MAHKLSLVAALAAALALSSSALADPRGAPHGDWRDGRGHDDGWRGGDVYIGGPWYGGDWNDCCQRQPIPHRQGWRRGLWYY